MTSLVRPAAGLLLAASLGLVTGCGSASTSTASGSVAPPASAGSAAGSAAVQPSAAQTDAAQAGGGSASDWCGVVKKNIATVTGTQMSSLLTGGSESAWKAYLAAAAKANQELVDAAPAQIKASVQTLQKDSATVEKMLSEANYDASKVKTQELLKAITSAEHQAASKALVEYTKKECSIDLTKPPA